MRLLDTRTGQFVEKDPRETRYAILSHTWDKVEQTYQDILDIQTSLSLKVREACAVARASSFQYIWINSGCIDKTSSSELSEAINLMYQWYAYAEVCYAYLSDVPSDEDPRAWLSRFRRSRWYERGWTLQELIATLTVTCLSKDWKVIGSKHSLSDIVEEITGIPEEALLHTRALDSFSVAQRRTTRVEDRAYSLLGIFC
ncbi:HET-domain-containing protein [Dichomitus squalens LYAD-421 SS1]|uniref:HET-domain-containing protein n=1 Tax=Dichomitus squalens (strain LYAD-421) TaxID=732165 RepID=R7SRC9_DICSQ|nr:HET-domain-containing protein [Dichomitus squalens LYAD-421 SS1]EJF58310.1 HET-domain-containing protein [Dichomitus squalens LYAD-421 SS1]